MKLQNTLSDYTSFNLDNDMEKIIEQKRNLFQNSQNVLMFYNEIKMELLKYTKTIKELQWFNQEFQKYIQNKFNMTKKKYSENNGYNFNLNSSSSYNNFNMTINNDNNNENNNLNHNRVLSSNASMDNLNNSGMVINVKTADKFPKKSKSKNKIGNKPKTKTSTSISLSPIVNNDSSPEKNKENEKDKEKEKEFEHLSKTLLSTTSVNHNNRIILLKHKENKGTLTSRVDGVRYSSGEYILNLDQDDLFLDNLFFENIYNKAKELNIDILQFSTLCYKNQYQKRRLNIKMPKNVLIIQPELRVAFLKKNRKNSLSNCSTRMIWDKFVRKKAYMEAIEDLGDEYVNHKMFLFEDTLMMFELSQIARSYYYDYNIFGYRLNLYDQGKSRDISSNKKSILAMNQLYFIKLLLYKISPLYDRYHIYKELCRFMGGELFKYLSIEDIDLIYEILEVINELERLYKNTDKHLLECVFKIKTFFGII